MNTFFKTSYLLALLLLAPLFCICDINKVLVSDSNLVEELLLRNYAEEELHLSAAQYTNLSQAEKANLQALGLGSWFRVIWNSIFGESKQWGQYREPGHRDEGPYMTFQYNLQNQLDFESFQNQVDTIRQRILQKRNGYFELYAQLYAQASRAYQYCNNDQCDNPITAKQAAFVYIVGLKCIYNLDSLKYTHAEMFSSATSERYDFRLKAEYMLLHSNAPGLNNFVDKLPTGFSTNLVDIAATALMWEKINSRSYELLNYLAAFDMIRWQHKLDASLGVNYNSPTINDIAKHLKKEYVVPLYNRCTKVQYLVNHNNYSIISASALGSAAIVLGDWGGAMLFDWDNWPNRWANVANYQIHDVMWSDPLIEIPFLQYPDGKLSAPGAVNSFAEGDHYFKITANALLPYMIAQSNYQNGVRTRSYRTYPLYTLGVFPSIYSKRMKTMLKDPDYDNIFKWFSNMSMPNGQGAGVDESWNDVSTAGILGVKKQTLDGTPLQTFFNTNAHALGLDLSTDITADYLAAFPNVVDWASIKSTQMYDGSTVLRNTQFLPNSEKAKHFLLGMAENKISDNSAWHEQSDVGQITLSVDSDYLLIDPAKWSNSYENELIGYSDAGEFTKHNIIYHGDDEGSYQDFITPIMPINQSFRMVMYGKTSTFSDTYTDSREVEIVKGPNYWYYVVNDRCYDVENKWCEVKFNGNSETDFSLNNGKATWNYSCSSTGGVGKWGLILETAATSSTVTYNSLQNKHGSSNFQFLQRDDATDGWGYHRTYSVKNTDKDYMHFISKITPYRCGLNNPVNTSIYNADDYSMLYVRIGKPNSTDSIRNYHISTHPTKDSVSYNGITLKGGYGYVSWDDDTLFRNGYCLSFTGFRKASAHAVKRLSYQNIDIIKSPKNVKVYYELISKYKYQGYIKSDTANQVTLYIGDLDLNYLMVAKDKLGNSLPSIHNSTDPNSYKYITFNVPMGLTEFTLELADPCLVSCFFPPTVMTIDTFFDFYQGSTETLGHNLDIVKDSGELHIRDGSKMSICPNYYLFNRDSITMRSDEANPLEMFPLYAAEEDLPGGGTGITNPAYLQRLASKRSMIIVNDRAALILDSGSFTHVGIGATILIRKGGTLYVKKGATLEIGSQAMNGYGELIAESGSYICIEDSSDLHFFVTSPDTNNTNIFFVPSGVNETVNLNGIQSQFKTGGRFAGAVNCLPLCSLWYYLEDYGVNNPDFGTNSLGRPISRFTLQSDTLCGEIDSIIYIDASKSLNEVKYRITATRPGLPDSVYFRKQEGSYGMLTNHEPVNISSLGFGTGTIKIELAVENTCGDTDYMVKNVYIPVGPTVNFTLSSDTICPGYGTLLIDGSASTSGQATIKHEWTVILIDTNSYSVGDTNQVMYGNVWQFDSSAVRSQFNFPGFRWIGGFNYLVGLKVYGNCDMVAERWDTVSVPFQVFVTSNGLHTTNGNIGSEVNLVGFITTAYDSFVWYPSNLVSDPDTLRPYSTTNQDSTLYTLTAYNGSCQAVDSIWIKHTEFVNLGVDTVVCIGSDVVIGNKLEASLLIGIMAYTDHATYSSAISILESSVPDANIKLGLFLYDNNYANFNSLKTTSSALTDLITKYGYNFYSNNSYYEVLDYYKTHSLSQTLDFFRGDYWPNHPELTSIIDNQISLYGGNSNFIAQTQGEVLNMLDQFKSNSGGISTNTIWYKNNNQVTTENDWMMLHDVINEPTKFTMVISSSSVVEYDDIMIYVDSILHPFFSLGTFTDSVTLQFINYTNANTFNNTTSYKWYFGDGDSSSLVNPIHSYAVKDSNYVVCLKASNTCGTYMYCDTLPLGSITINGFGKKSNSDSPNSWKEPSTVKQTVDKIDNRNYLGNNRPNPFRGTTDIDFEVKPETNEARIRIVNQLGQLMKDTKLYAVKGTITIDAEGWQAGLYHCNLVVDGVVVESRLMIIK